METERKHKTDKKREAALREIKKRVSILDSLQIAYGIEPNHRLVGDVNNIILLIYIFVNKKASYGKLVSFYTKM